MSLAPGSRVGPYEVTALLGAGGMGKVWRARHTGLKRDDALKVLPEAVAGDRERLARFEREAEILASLNHPHIRFSPDGRFVAYTSNETGRPRHTALVARAPAHEGLGRRRGMVRRPEPRA